MSMDKWVKQFVKVLDYQEAKEFRYKTFTMHVTREEEPLATILVDGEAEVIQVRKNTKDKKPLKQWTYSTKNQIDKKAITEFITYLKELVDTEGEEGDVAIQLVTEVPKEDEDEGLKRARFPSFHDKFKHPKHFCLPCCFKLDTDRNRKIKEMCAADAPKDKDGANADANTDTDAEPEAGPAAGVIGNEKYIKGELYTPLEQNRFGMLPAPMVKYFGYTKHGNRHDGTGLMSDETEGLFRRGIRQSDQSFLECMVHVLGSAPTAAALMAKVTEALDITAFLKMENGRVLKMFVDEQKSVYDPDDFNTFRDWFRKQKKYIQLMSLAEVQRSLDSVTAYSDDMDLHQDVLREFMLFWAFTAFKAYLADMSIVKRHELLLDLFVNVLQDDINPERLNVLVLEVNSETGKVYMDCYINKDAGSVLDRNKPIVMVLKRGVYYEPLYHVSNRKNNLAATMKLDLLSGMMPKSLKKMVQFFTKNCGSATSLQDTAAVSNLLLHMKSLGHTPRYIVVDYGFKACGAILKGNVYVPFLYRENIFFSKDVQYIYLHEVPNYKCMKKEEDVRAIYAAVQKFTKSNFYKVDHVVEGGLFIDGGHVFVPLRLSKDDRRRVMFKYGLFLLVGQEDEDPRTVLLRSMYADHDLLHRMQQSMQEYMDAHTDVKHELAFLRDARNPFPEAFKRRKVMDVLKAAFTENKKEGVLHERIVDLWLEKSLALSTYVQERLRRYQSVPGEVLMDNNDILKGRLDRLKAQQENPYEYLLGRVDQLEASYVTVDEDGENSPMAPGEALVPIFKAADKDLEGKDLPVKFRKMLKGFRILETQGDYGPGYALNVFLTVARRLSAANKTPLTSDLYRAAIQRELVLTFQGTGAAAAESILQITNNPTVKEIIKKKYGTTKNFSLAHVLEAMESVRYYPSVWDVKHMARMAGVNIVLSGRKTLKNPDAIEIIDNQSAYFIILQFSYDRFMKIDRFELYFRESDRHYLFDKKELPEAFRALIDAKIKTFEVEADVDDE